MKLVIVDGPYGLKKYDGDEIRTERAARLYRGVFSAASKAGADHVVVFGVFASLSWIYENFLRAGPFELRQPCVWHKPDSVGGGSRSFVPQHEQFLHLSTPSAGFNADAVRVPYGARAASGVKMKGGREVGWQPNPLGARRGNVMTFTGDRLKNKVDGRTQTNKHPCVKPEALLDVIVKSCSSQGDDVIEPFVGSDTLQLVCARAERAYRGWPNAQQFIDTFGG